MILTIVPAYDEEDGDFVFTRGSKRTKTAPTQPEPIPTPAPVPPAKKGRKSKEVKERDNDTNATAKKPKGRKMSFSTPKAENDLVVPKRKTTRSSAGRPQDDGIRRTASKADPADYDSVDIVGNASVEETDGPAVDHSKQSTVISLPFSDTPIINRNKELRKKGGIGARRSSLGLRGRRAAGPVGRQRPGHAPLGAASRGHVAEADRTVGRDRGPYRVSGG